jgi:hypothetical protein
MEEDTGAENEEGYMYQDYNAYAYYGGYRPNGFAPQPVTI